MTKDLGVQQWDFSPQTEALPEAALKFEAAPQFLNSEVPTKPAEAAPDVPKERYTVTDKPDVSINEQINMRVANLRDKDRDPGYYSVQLPSNFAFYQFKELSISEVKGKHQAKFVKATANENTHYLVEAITSLLGDGVNAYDLTPEDFWWVLYWLLISSYPDRRNKVVVTCANHDHQERVRLGELDPATLRSLHEYSRPSLTETILDVDSLNELDLSALAKYKLKPLTMRDTLDWDDKYGKIEDDELYFLQDLAALLDGAHHGTLEERTAIVADMSLAELDTLKQYKEAVTAYGVEAFITHKCKECGAETVSKIAASASDFL